MRWLRNYAVELALVAVLGLAVAFFGYLAVGLLPKNVVDEQFIGRRALENVSRQLAFGSRGVGTRNSVQMGEWLVQQLTSLGWDVIIQEFDVGGEVQGRNYVAVRSPSIASAPVALLATHHDTRLLADADPNEAYHTRPTPGANSGASGVAVLLELARTLDVETAGHTVCLAFFDAEENAGVPGWQGQLGSQHFVDRLEEDVIRCAGPSVVVALDMVGGAEQRFFFEPGSSPEINRAIWQTADEAGYGENFVAEPAQEAVQETANSYTAFVQAGLPAALLADLDYPQRYTLADTLDKLSAESLQRVGRTLETWLEQGAPITNTIEN
jgi:glutaminyl-peptide cyclotransferase